MAFENALAVYNEECNDRWEKIVAIVPGKDAAKIKLHYKILVEYIDCIEAGLIPLPSFVSSGEGGVDQDVEIHGTMNKLHSANFHSSDVNPIGKGGSKVDQEWCKGIAWTKEEHMFVFYSFNMLSLSFGGHIHSFSGTNLDVRNSGCEMNLLSIARHQ